MPKTYCVDNDDDDDVLYIYEEETGEIGTGGQWLSSENEMRRD